MHFSGVVPHNERSYSNTFLSLKFFPKTLCDCERGLQEKNSVKFYEQ